MGLFSRIRNAFTRRRADDVQSQARAVVEQEVGDLLHDPDMEDVIWDEIDTALEPVTLKDFAVDNDGAELFRAGWVDMGEDTQDARDAFFDLMEAYDISRDEFDWDAWRDWYEDA